MCNVLCVCSTGPCVRAREKDMCVSVCLCAVCRAFAALDHAQSHSGSVASINGLMEYVLAGVCGVGIHVIFRSFYLLFPVMLGLA